MQHVIRKGFCLAWQLFVCAKIFRLEFFCSGLLFSRWDWGLAMPGPTCNPVYLFIHLCRKSKQVELLTLQHLGVKKSSETPKGFLLYMP